MDALIELSASDTFYNDAKEFEFEEEHFWSLRELMEEQGTPEQLVALIGIG